MQGASDKHILNELRENTNVAFTKLYKAHFAMAKYFVLKNNGSHTDAEDIFQDALIVIYQKSLEPNFKLSCSIKTYIYSVVRNLWLKQLRNQSKKVTITDFETFIAIAEDNQKEDNTELINLVMLKLNQLGENCRKLLTGFYFHKKTMEELATELSYTNAKNAKNQKYKCMQQLKKLVKA